ncbi:MAG: RNA polymerase-binding protein DksA [SAR324 cluster bacterium]|uniref:RNA polymerase-binding protein DksA n=1 Tax=SAR324 cluster bacterium TaxID=2024889 RepID=A0A2A4SWV4_9DELT|nr:MAG: RNA polymerase-binding protein DksA [SAR324 cluster bacterium]
MEFNNSPELTEEETAFFRVRLERKLSGLVNGSDDTVHEMQGSKQDFPDPNDRASFEFERNTTLRIRDRERKLIRKIQKALKRLKEGTYNECEECEEYIGKNRLNARPVTSRCIQCKEAQEQKERLQR